MDEAEFLKINQQVQERQKSLATKNQPTVKLLKFDIPTKPIINQQSVDQKRQREIDYAEKKRVYETRQSRKSYISRTKESLIATIPALFQNARIKDFSPLFCDRLNSRKPEQGLYLWGSTGTGKSHAMSALMRQAIISRQSVRRTTWEKLCLEIRATFNSNMQAGSNHRSGFQTTDGAINFLKFPAYHYLTKFTYRAASGLDTI